MVYLATLGKLTLYQTQAFATGPPNDQIPTARALSNTPARGAILSSFCLKRLDRQQQFRAANSKLKKKRRKKKKKSLRAEHS
ncbi:hypothetical protein ACLOJK_002999 [Asimina triloba]